MKTRRPKKEKKKKTRRKKVSLVVAGANMYPDTTKKVGGSQSGGKRGDVSRFIADCARVMGKINSKPIKVKTITDAIQIPALRAIFANMSWSNYTKDHSPRGVYQNSTRELEDIIHFYWCFFAYLMLIQSKLPEPKPAKIKNLADELMPICKKLIDEYAKWNFMIKSDDKTNSDPVDLLTFKIVEKQPLLLIQYTIIEKCQEDILINRSKINNVLTIFFNDITKHEDFTAYKLDQFETFKSAVANNTATTVLTPEFYAENVNQINYITRSKENFAGIFEGKNKQAKKSIIFDFARIFKGENTQLKDKKENTQSNAKENTQLKDKKENTVTSAKVQLFKLLTLATENDLKTIFADKTKSDSIIEKMHATTTVNSGGGRFDSITNSFLGKKEKDFNIRSAYDNIFEKAEPGELTKIIVTSLIETEKVVDVINILGTPDYNGDAIGKIRGYADDDPILKEKLSSALEKDQNAKNFYDYAKPIPPPSAKSAESNQKPVVFNSKGVSAVEKRFRESINKFVQNTTDNDNIEKMIKEIHAMYDDLALEPELKRDRALLKNMVDNLIEYTDSVTFGRWIEQNVVGEKQRLDALTRRDLLIDQFTRLNTKPILDPILERVVTTFWPEASSKRYAKPTPKTIKHETIIKTKLYPSVPTVMIDKTNKGADNNKTYGSKIMTLTEKVDGDQSDYDTLGVELFLNALMVTGSNINFDPKAAYEEEVKYDEELDNSQFVATDDD
jgi:hypothetical protein